ncbi:ureidoglycolate lyase [Tistlia consotensis]|uniref:Ureidoglycolate lyase n=1 Tax=Tistlia consotensis USBA 355 TaxID=560819 RepID=A0A1Y6CPV6_9PROT|nr:ureidoglycolate lyase [Tistlia consotensis]SMF81163.1 ureidoglycolate lyase [Tistlia consotensis USBA 355]SNS23471.1 ureidoglycolate lyase [Tistlia consotensis]
MQRFLDAEPLTAAAFAPFGAVIEARDETSVPINQGYTTRFHALATAETGADGQAILSLFRARPRPPQLAMLERHPLGTQAFVPLGGRPWLVVVASAPSGDACRAFLASGDQGVQYAVGTWHHPLLAVEPQDFLVVDRAGPGENLEKAALPEPVTLRW